MLPRKTSLSFMRGLLHVPCFFPPVMYEPGTIHYARLVVRVLLLLMCGARGPIKMGPILITITGDDDRLFRSLEKFLDPV